MDVGTMIAVGCEKKVQQFDRQALIQEIGSHKLREIYTNMVRTRALDKRIDEMLQSRKVTLMHHGALGQEATPNAACAALEKTDYMLPYHRGWAWAIGKGMKPALMLAECLGRKTGYNKGKSGVQLGDPETRVMGRPGLQGAHLSIAAGIALSLKMRQTGEVVISFFGDGAAATPNFYEGLNLASVWKAPAIYVCENNGYSVTQKVREVMNIDDIADRAVAFGIPGIVVDGNDAVLVYKATLDAVIRARKGEGPTLIEAKTYRLVGHYFTDPYHDGGYRSHEEIEQWKARCPIHKLEGDLLAGGFITEGEIAAISAAANKEMEEAAEFAISSQLNTEEELLDVHDLYA